jgi:DNA-binding transcriptional ArsR family regulator
MLYNFMSDRKRAEIVRQEGHEVREGKGSGPSRTLALDEQLISELEGLLSELDKMAFWLDLSPKTLTDYVRLLRKALSAGARIASWGLEYVEDIVTEFLRYTYELSKKNDVQVYQLATAFTMSHLLLLTLGLVYDFFEDGRVKRIDELTEEYEELFRELINEDKKDPYAVLRPELANRASALLGEILSVIRGEDEGNSDEEAAEPHG